MRPEHTQDQQPPLSIRRDQTAIRRTSCSRPIALALSDGIITKGTDLFDYGCGHGDDVRYLRNLGVQAHGWDPHYKPKQKHLPAQIVNLGYVLNVIENPSERNQTLIRAFELCKEVLIVAVRVEWGFIGADQYNDGVLTRRQTFQKIYAQSEFRQYVETTLERQTHVADLGVVYVFKDSDAEARYIANRAFTRRLEYRTDLVSDFNNNHIATAYVTLANKLGRFPLPDEFPDYQQLIELFGPDKRLHRLALGRIDHQAFQGSRDQRRDDILTYIAMLRLGKIKPPGISKLPVSIKSDIKAIWSTYGEALKEGEEFLFSIGKPEVVAKVCATCPVGKLLPSHVYIHRSAEDELPPLLRVLLFAGKEIVGELPYDLVKFAKDGRAVSFLLYKDFDSDPHPALLRSVKVYLPKATFDVREYFNSDNPPIIHRKETFVLPSYVHFEEFRRLSEQEEEYGLLSSSEIGYRRYWINLLAAKGLKIENHSVMTDLNLSGVNQQ
jgi:DNA phosphorothioation-associated putative methyltransferase